jgi:hypothetical protein
VFDELPNRTGGKKGLIQELKYIDSKSNIGDLDLRTYHAAKTILARTKVDYAHKERTLKARFGREGLCQEMNIQELEEDEDLWEAVDEEYAEPGHRGTLSSKRFVDKHQMGISTSNLNVFQKSNMGDSECQIDTGKLGQLDSVPRKRLSGLSGERSSLRFKDGSNLQSPNPEKSSKFIRSNETPILGRDSIDQNPWASIMKPDNSH